MSIFFNASATLIKWKIIFLTFDTFVSFGMASIPWRVLCQWELRWFHLPLACWVNLFSHLLSSFSVCSSYLRLFYTTFLFLSVFLWSFFYLVVFICYLWIQLDLGFVLVNNFIKHLLNNYLSCKHFCVSFYNWRENKVKLFL